MSQQPFSIATWNVNSLKVRVSHLEQWLASRQIDVIGLQETKATDETFPMGDMERLGLSGHWHGQRTYNGVALLAREPISDVVKGIPGYEDPQARVIAGTVRGVRILNVYVPNGQALDSDKYTYKLDWLTRLQRYIKAELVRYPQLVVMGDFNIAPTDQDVHDPKAWDGSVLVSAPERDALAAIEKLGLVDVFRRFEQAPNSFSWWDYRAAGFRRNAGLRIDLILTSESLAKQCVHCEIDKTPRHWERPSDHTPVIAAFDII